MSLDSAWFYFAFMAIALGVAGLPTFRNLDAVAGEATRHRAVDGLRGFLALGVFVYHLVVTHGFIATGQWQAPGSRFYALLGPIGVSLFFMITGFLFWGQVLRARGRPRWHALYIGRLWRIAPMYLFVVLVMLVIVFARTGFRLHEQASVVVASVLQWLALGMIDAQPDVNGVRATHVLAGVTWTIWYEWIFYASLVVTAIAARFKSHARFVFAALLLSIGARSLLQVDAVGFAMLFLCGMAIASLLHTNRSPRLTQPIASGIAAACLLAVGVGALSGYATSTGLLLALFLYCVCNGASLFGLLTTTAAQRLGHISYSLYLMQGLVLTALLSIEPLRRAAMASPQGYWAVGVLCLATLVCCAALGYVHIERPGIALGKRWVLRLDQRWARRTLLRDARQGAAAPVRPRPTEA